MTWQVLAILSTITVSIAYLLQRVLLKDEDSDPIGYAIVFQFVLGFISLLFALSFGKFIFPSSPDQLPRFILSAILWAGSTVFVFKALKILNAGETTVLTSSSAVVTIALGTTLLGEHLRITTLIGSVFILASIWIINTEKLSFSSKKGVLFALISALCTGLASVNDAFIMRSYEAFSYTTIMSFLPGFVLLIVFPKRIKTIKKLCTSRFMLLMSILCIFFSLQAITYYLAFQNGAPVTTLTPLTKASIVLTVILAAVFLGERSNLLKKFLAAVIVIIGAILLGS